MAEQQATQSRLLAKGFNPAQLPLETVPLRLGSLPRSQTDKMPL